MANQSLNSVLTSDIIAKEAAYMFSTGAEFVGALKNRSNQFQPGYGSSIRLNRGLQVSSRGGDSADAANWTYSAQTADERAVTLAINRVKGKDVSFSDEELNMDVDSFSEEILKPLMTSFVDEIEADIIDLVMGQVYNVTNDAAFDFANVVDMGTILGDQAASRDGRKLFVPPTLEGAIIKDMKSYYNPQPEIANQIKSRKIATIGSFDVMVNSGIKTYNRGDLADAAGAVVADFTNGGKTLTISGLTASKKITKGTVLQFTGFYKVHPITKTTLPYLFQATASADAAIGTDGVSATVTLTDEVYYEGPYQNVSGKIVSSTVVTVLGAATNTSYAQALGFVPDFASVAFGKLVNPKGVENASSSTQKGITLHYVQYFDGDSRKMKSRFDAHYGVVVQHPEMAVRFLQTA